MHHPARGGRQATNIHETSMPTMTSCPLSNRLVVIDTTDLYMRAPLCIYVCAYMCVRCFLLLLHGIKMSEVRSVAPQSLCKHAIESSRFSRNDFNIIVVSTFRIVSRNRKFDDTWDSLCDGGVSRVIFPL